MIECAAVRERRGSGLMTLRIAVVVRTAKTMEEWRRDGVVSVA